jgi:hypothetical protein
MLSAIADIVTFVSFLVSVVVTWVTINTQHKVSDLQKKNLLKTRTPEHLKKLKALSLDINRLADDFKSNKREISTTLAVVKSEIKHSVSILPTQYNSRSKDFNKNLSEFESRIGSAKRDKENKAEDAMWKCINILNEIINDLQNILQDHKKEIK